MTTAQAKEVLRKVSVDIMNDGHAVIEGGTPESRALIVLWTEKKS